MTRQRDSSHAPLQTEQAVPHKARNGSINGGNLARKASSPKRHAKVSDRSNAARSAAVKGTTIRIPANGVTGMPDGAQHREHEGYLIKELQHRLRTQIEARIRAKGIWLSFPHSAVLMTLREQPGLSGAQLARLNSVTAQTMNGLLQPLEAKGLIERRPDPENARVLKCYLKPKGAAILDEGMQEASAIFHRMLSKLTSRERDEFRRILHRCIDALQAGAVNGDTAHRKTNARKVVRH